MKKADKAMRPTLMKLCAAIFITLITSHFTGVLQPQDELTPLDLTVIEVIERISVPPPQPYPVNQCSGEPNYDQVEWFLMDNEQGEAVLCNTTSTEIRELPIEANWLAYEVGRYRQPSISPDGEWVVLITIRDEQYLYYAYSLLTETVVELGTIPGQSFASFPPLAAIWLSPTQGAVIYPTNSDSIWDTLYQFDLSTPNSMTQVMRGYPHGIDQPPRRVESLYSGQWLSGMAGTFMGDGPCAFFIADGSGARTYPIEFDYQVEAYTSDPDFACGVIRSDGENITVLRVIDFAEGLSELILMPVTTPDSEPIVLYRGEIDYMLINRDGTTLSVLGTDGQIPNEIYQPCYFADTSLFVGSDLLLATRRGTHIIPAEEYDDFYNLGIRATSPDKSRILLSNGAIYDVAEGRLVANITAGRTISGFTHIVWHDDGRIVFTERYNPPTDEQITIRLKTEHSN